MQVRIPNIGRIQTLSAIHATKIAIGTAKSFILLPELSEELNGCGVVDLKTLEGDVSVGSDHLAQSSLKISFRCNAS